MNATPIRPVKIGDAVRVVDENYAEHVGLVTAVHGIFRDDAETAEGAAAPYVPCINVLFVSDDDAKHDPYGRQTERLSSLMHYQSVQAMPRPGRFWTNLQ